MPHRYFTTDIRGGQAALGPEDSRHLCRVLRARPGQAVVLCDGAGTDYDARVTEASPERCLLEILSARPSVSEPTVQATLYVGYPKADKLESIVQKATELGAARIVPFTSAFCVAGPGDGAREQRKTQRLARIALEAAKQAGRGAVPAVEPAIPFGEMLRRAAAADLALFCYEGGGEALHSRLADAQGIRCAAIITGSEGGFSPEEARAARQAGLAFVGLGPRILRCETAPLAVLSVVMALTGNLQAPPESTP